MRTSGPWLAVAVSDGAGSRKLSRYGASYAAEALCEHLLRAVREGVASAANDREPVNDSREKAKEGEKGPHELAVVPFFDSVIVQPADGLSQSCGTLNWYLQNSLVPPTETPELSGCVRHAFQETRRGLEQFGQARGLPLSELHCTLLGLLLNTTTGALGVGHIGDGLVISYGPDSGVQLLVEAPTPPDVGEVYLVTQKDWETYSTFRAFSPDETKGNTTYCLMSDGVADDCQPPPKDAIHRWARDIDSELRKQDSLPQSATRLLRWLATYQAKGSWDDRTLVAVMRYPEGDQQAT